jgi:hypothetical protein
MPYFDYRDCHEFEVQVADVRPQAEAGDYPRVVEAEGDTPSQYGW